MTQKADRSREHTEQPAGEFVEVRKERLGDLAAAQSELLDRWKEINRQWAERPQVEAALGADIAKELTSSRSLSDAASAIQRWTSKHLELAVDDARRLLDDSQQMMDASTRFWASAGRTALPFEASRGLIS